MKKMFKQTLSFVSVILAMAFVFMAPANAMNYDTYDPDTVSYDTDDLDQTSYVPEVAAAIPIAFHNFDMMKLKISHDIMEKQDHNSYFKPVKHKSVVFSNIKGGGFSLAQASKTGSYT